MHLPDYPHSYIYLHGFASSPQSAKARYLRDRFATVALDLNVPDLNQDDFSHLTLTRQIEQVAAEFPESSTPITLIGSSFGGLTSVWLAQQHAQVQRLILLAPAFEFLSHWNLILGEESMRRWESELYLPIYHYGQMRSLPLHYKFITNACHYRDEQLQRPVHTLILHGLYDEVISIQASRNFAKDRPWVQLIELESDHSLTNVMPEIWQAICQFCRLPIQPV